MKNIIVAAFCVTFIFASCKDGADDKNISTDAMDNPDTHEGNPDKSALAEIDFEEKEYNFGTIAQGEKAEHEFKFKNTGKSDLIISDVNASCGCTVPEYPKEPIKPGEEGKIKVVFNSKGREGKQNKIITVVTNTNPNNNTLTLSGEVVIKK